MSSLRAFHRYVGIDYSGAQTPISSLKGLRVYMTDEVTPPSEVEPPQGPRKYWTRRGIARAGRDVFRRPANAGWYRSWLLVSAAVFSKTSAPIRLDSVSRSF